MTSADAGVPTASNQPEPDASGAPVVLPVKAVAGGSVAGRVTHDGTVEKTSDSKPWCPICWAPILVCEGTELCSENLLHAWDGPAPCMTQVTT